MIVNKVLNITSDDVENQKDLQILLDWKRTLQNKINELKVRLEEKNIKLLIRKKTNQFLLGHLTQETII